MGPSTHTLNWLIFGAVTICIGLTLLVVSYAVGSVIILVGLIASSLHLSAVFLQRKVERRRAELNPPSVSEKQINDLTHLNTESRQLDDRMPEKE